MDDVALWRLNVLRVMYAVLTAGLILMIWPLLLNQPEGLEHMRGVVWSMLAGVSILAAFGIRYPLQMLPVLLFEFVWKAVWLVSIGLPNRMDGTLTPAHQQTWTDCIAGIVMLLCAIPWRYVWRKYFSGEGERWRRASPVAHDVVTSHVA